MSVSPAGPYRPGCGTARTPGRGWPHRRTAPRAGADRGSGRATRSSASSPSTARPRKDCWASGAPCCRINIAAGLGVVLHANRSAIELERASCGRAGPRGSGSRRPGGTPSPGWTPSGAGSSGDLHDGAQHRPRHPPRLSPAWWSTWSPPGNGSRPGPPRRAAR
ncbi:hypothetical protein HBB16_16725 [Pseudonocardia sp. MCCB 268]|nr:hypothetical protein [Pseudonocardia cytotoxica]